MYAYGIKKGNVKEIQTVELKDRKPSMGIKNLDVDIPKLNSNEVLVKIKASALNFNSIWSGLCHPLSSFQLINRHVQRNPRFNDHIQDYAIYGSDASGIIAEVGEGVINWNVGDQVIIHCNVINLNEPIAQLDGMLPNSQSIWGYETNFGAFAEYCKVETYQLIKKPKSLSWEDAGSFCLTLSTAYRMLISPNGLQIMPGNNCLVWGAAGGLGSFAVQLIKLSGGNPIAIVSNRSKVKICKKLGVSKVIDRSDTNFGGFTLENGEPNYLAWRKAKLILKDIGVNNVHYVFDHVGRETLGVSLSLLERGGSIVTCAASSGYNAVIDLRYLWMSLKKIVGSHFANFHEASKAAELVFDGKIKPVIHSVNSIHDLPRMADEMYSNSCYGKIVFKHD